MIICYSYLVSSLRLVLKEFTFEQYLQFFLVRPANRILFHFIKTKHYFPYFEASHVKVLDIKITYALSCLLQAQEALILLEEIGDSLHLTREFRL